MLLQIMTTEEWYTIMWGLIDAEFRYSAIYFYLVIVFGSYFFWNIFINGVIAIFLRLNLEHTVRRCLADTLKEAQPKPCCGTGNFCCGAERRRRARGCLVAFTNIRCSSALHSAVKLAEMRFSYACRPSTVCLCTRRWP